MRSAWASLKLRARLKAPDAGDDGGVPEWSNGAVSKTVVRYAYRGFESHPLRQQVLDIADFSGGIRTGGTVRGSLRAFDADARAKVTERK